jgi:hypothetical protein
MFQVGPLQLRTRWPSSEHVFVQSKALLHAEPTAVANDFWEKKDTNTKRNAIENSSDNIFLTILS